MDDISRFDRQSPPDQEIRGAHIRRSSSAELQMELDAPRIVRYSQPAAKTVYPKGVTVRFYDGKGGIKTYLYATKAVSFDDRDIMQASDSVVVIDYGSGDTIYLQDIVWRKDEDLIFSNHTVRAVNGNRVTYGDGFVSDGQMTNLRVTRQRGVIEFQE
jgi:hypothetical protein